MRPLPVRACLFALAGALGLAGCATAPAPPAGVEVGRILTYTRSNSDGGEAETVHVYRRTASRIEVIKARERCTSAAFVSAELDPRWGDPVELVGGRLRPGGGHSEEAWLTLSPDGRQVALRLGERTAPASATVAVTERPWRLYDFDLASLTAAPPGAAKRGGTFRFGLALTLVRESGLELRWLGPVTATFVGREMRAGAATNHFRVGGPGLPGASGGELWTRAGDGYIVAAAFGLPNHVEYRDFRLDLRAVDHGEAAWSRILTDHYAGCAAPAEG